MPQENLEMLIDFIPETPKIIVPNGIRTQDPLFAGREEAGMPQENLEVLIYSFLKPKKLLFLMNVNPEPLGPDPW